MVKEVSAGCVVFRYEKGKPLYLLLKAKLKSEYWDFPKGNIEKGEQPLQTALREVREETGIVKVKPIEGFEKKINWFYRRENKLIYKEVVYFLGETDEKKIKISPEHIDARWCSYEEALNLLSFKNSQEVLKAANDFITKLSFKK